MAQAGTPVATLSVSRNYVCRTHCTLYNTFQKIFHKTLHTTFYTSFNFTLPIPRIINFSVLIHSASSATGSAICGATHGE